MIYKSILACFTAIITIHSESFGSSASEEGLLFLQEDTDFNSSFGDRMTPLVTKPQVILTSSYADGLNPVTVTQLDSPIQLVTLGSLPALRYKNTLYSLRGVDGLKLDLTSQDWRFDPNSFTFHLLNTLYNLERDQANQVGDLNKVKEFMTKEDQEKAQKAIDLYTKTINLILQRPASESDLNKLGFLRIISNYIAPNLKGHLLFRSLVNGKLHSGFQDIDILNLSNNTILKLITDGNDVYQYISYSIVKSLFSPLRNEEIAKSFFKVSGGDFSNRNFASLLSEQTSAIFSKSNLKPDNIDENYGIDHKDLSSSVLTNGYYNAVPESMGYYVISTQILWDVATHFFRTFNSDGTKFPIKMIFEKIVQSTEAAVILTPKEKPTISNQMRIIREFLRNLLTEIGPDVSKEIDRYFVLRAKASGISVESPNIFKGEDEYDINYLVLSNTDVKILDTVTAVDPIPDEYKGVKEFAPLVSLINSLDQLERGRQGFKSIKELQAQFIQQLNNTTTS